MRRAAGGRGGPEPDLGSGGRQAPAVPGARCAGPARPGRAGLADGRAGPGQGRPRRGPAEVDRASPADPAGRGPGEPPQAGRRAGGPRPPHGGRPRRARRSDPRGVRRGGAERGHPYRAGPGADGRRPGLPPARCRPSRRAAGRRRGRRGHGEHQRRLLPVGCPDHRPPRRPAGRALRPVRDVGPRPPGGRARLLQGLLVVAHRRAGAGRGGGGVVPRLLLQPRGGGRDATARRSPRHRRRSGRVPRPRPTGSTCSTSCAGAW